MSIAALDAIRWPRASAGAIVAISVKAADASILGKRSAAGHAQAPKVLKISHQFPAATGDSGDFRDRLAKKFAAEVEKRSNGQLKIAWPTKVLAGDIQPGFAIDLAHKDLSLIVAAAHDNRVPAPVAAAAREAFSMARAANHGRKDFSAMVDVLCELAGIEKPRLVPTSG